MRIIQEIPSDNCDEAVNDLIDNGYVEFKSAYQRVKIIGFEQDDDRKCMARFAAIMYNLIIYNGGMCFEIINDLWDDLFESDLFTNTTSHKRINLHGI